MRQALHRLPDRLAYLSDLYDGCTLRALMHLRTVQLASPRCSRLWAQQRCAFAFLQSNSAVRESPEVSSFC